MRKILKGKLSIDDLLNSYESFLRKDGSLKPDSGYHFAIVISALSTSTSIYKEKSTMFYHKKFVMTVESRLRSLLVHLDTILNPAKTSNK